MLPTRNSLQSLSGRFEYHDSNDGSCCCRRCAQTTGVWLVQLCHQPMGNVKMTLPDHHQTICQNNRKSWGSIPNCCRNWECGLRGRSQRAVLGPPKIVQARPHNMCVESLQLSGGFLPTVPRLVGFGVLETCGNHCSLPLEHGAISSKMRLWQVPQKVQGEAPLGVGVVLTQHLVKQESFTIHANASAIVGCTGFRNIFLRHLEGAFEVDWSCPKTCNFKMGPFDC